MPQDENEKRHSAGLRWIGADELARLVPMADAIGLVGDAMRQLSKGGAIAPQRWTMPLDTDARMGLMPGALPGAGLFGIKVLSLFGEQRRGSLPSHQGVMLLFDLADGHPVCALDSAALTLLRTAAATALATRTLARPDSTTLAVLGCGELALPHVAALRQVMPLRRVHAWNRTRAGSERLAAALAGDLEVIVRESAAEAARDADIVCTLTAATQPLIDARDLRPGQHLNLVGSSVDGPREVTDELVARTRYFVDCREHALSQAAELRSAIGNGIVPEDHIVAEIGEVLSGSAPGRRGRDEITVFKSLGHVVQDLAVAGAAALRECLPNAREIAKQA